MGEIRRVKFGRYEQGNGIEPIEWRVLDSSDEGILLLSEYALDCKSYAEDEEDYLWYVCSLREWLNGEFLEKAFTEAERKQIVETTVYSGDGWIEGDETEDRIFLLDKEELRKYLRHHGACKPTSYAVKQGACEKDDKFCYWWLRNQSNFDDRLEFADEEGVPYTSSSYDGMEYGVRPALWIKSES